MDHTLGHAALALLEEQKKQWEMLRKGYASLDTMMTRVFAFEGFEIKLQFNPGRMASSSAKVDAKSIAERKCFLCPANLPAEQKGLAFGEKYLVLCNPFPIFPAHYTVPDRGHVPQRIAGRFGDLLELARGMGPELTVFYNGPKCGASAPDHFHFQAGNAGVMPVDGEFAAVREKYGKRVVDARGVRVDAVGEGYLRPMVTLESGDGAALERACAGVYEAAREVLPGEEEPMMNIHCSHTAGRGWRVLFFPRVKHRPAFYSAPEPERIMLSPAGVEFGGVCTTPVEEHFHRVTREHLVQMYRECSLDKAGMEQLVGLIRARLG